MHGAARKRSDSLWNAQNCTLRDYVPQWRHGRHAGEGGKGATARNTVESVCVFCGTIVRSVWYTLRASASTMGSWYLPARCALRRG